MAWEPKDRLMTIREIADLGNFSTSTVRRKVKEGLFVPVPGLGKQTLRFDPRAVRRALGLDPKDGS